MNRTVLLVGVAIAALLLGVLFVGLGKNPNEIRSPLVGRPAPTFALREVGTGRTSSRASETSHAAGAPTVSSADGSAADRRSRSRPWAKRSAAAGLPAAAAAPAAPASRKQAAAAAGGGSDSDWQEF